MPDGTPEKKAGKAILSTFEETKDLEAPEEKRIFQDGAENESFPSTPQMNIKHQSMYDNEIQETLSKPGHQQYLIVSTPTWVNPKVLEIPCRIAWGKESKYLPFGGKSKGILASIFYVTASTSMVLANKIVLSKFNWNAPISLMLYQNTISAASVLILRWKNVIPKETIPLRLVQMWLPVNILFVGMLLTSLLSLQYLQVAMVTILKSCTNLLTALGETFVDHTRHGVKVWGSLFLMVASAVVAGRTDLSFNIQGYCWQGFNCFLTAAYILTLRQVMKEARQVTQNGAPLGEFSMVLLNSVLSLPFCLALVVLMGEATYVMESPLTFSPPFLFAATLSGLLGLLISFSSMWCLHLTSPTTFSLVGSCNKVPLAILGIMLFNAPVNLPNLAGIFVALFGGILFAYAKVSQKRQRN